MPTRGQGYAGVMALVVAAIAALIAAPAASALTWAAPATISAPGEITANAPSVAMDAAGDAVAAWSNVTGQFYECPCAVRAAARGAGGAFGAPVTLATNAGQKAENVSDVQAAMDSAGDAVVVWDASHKKQLGEIEGFSHDVYASVRPAGGAFGEPQLLSAEGKSADGGGVPQVTMDSAGDITVAWISGLGWFSSDPVPQLQVVRRPAGGAFSSPKALFGAGIAGPWDFRLATSPNGRTAVAFTYKAPANCEFPPCDPLENGAEQEVKIATAGPGADLGTPVKVSPKVTSTSDLEGPSVEARSVAIDDSGDVVADYEEGGAGFIFGNSRRDEEVTSDAGGAFSSPVSLGATGKSFPGEVAIGPTGESTVSWSDSVGARAAPRPLGGAFGSPQTLSAEGFSPILASGSNLATANGDVLAALLLEGATGGERVAAALKPAGGSFEAPVTVEAGTATEHVGLDAAIDAAADSAVLVWADPQGEGPGAIRAALTGASSGGGPGGGEPGGGGGGSNPTPPGPGPQPTPQPTPHPIGKCRKGFKKKRVHGKTRCVKIKRKHHHKKHRRG